MPAPALIALNVSGAGLGPIVPDVPVPPTCRRVALLVGGHSLLEHWTPEVAAGFDEVVAVNGAAYVTRVDWAVMVDRKVVEGLLREKSRHPRRGIVTYAAYRNAARQAGVAWHEIPTLGRNFKSYTMPRAVLWALRRCGAGTIEVFGMDFGHEVNDVGGLKGCHDGNRWKQESQTLRAAWSAQVVAVHGRLNASRLAFIRGELPSWPG